METTTEKPTAIAIVQIKAEDYGLQATEAKQVEAAFIPMLNKMAELEDQYNAITASFQPFPTDPCLRTNCSYLCFYSTL